MAVTSCLGFYCSLQLSTAIAAYVSFLMLINPLTYQTHSKSDKTSAHVELISLSRKPPVVIAVLTWDFTVSISSRMCAAADNSYAPFVLLFQQERPLNIVKQSIFLRRPLPIVEHLAQVILLSLNRKQCLVCFWLSGFLSYEFLLALWSMGFGASLASVWFPSSQDYMWLI